jgi:hypothetical protein
MAIPAFNEYGSLPEGIHDCRFDEAARRFGAFQGSDSRPRLWAKFTQFMREAKASGLVQVVLIDGSFVIRIPDPNDIDLVLVVPASHDFSADLPPAQYNIFDQKRVRRRFELDIVVVKNASENLEWAIAFFHQIRQQPGIKKGILRLTL